MKNTQIEHDNWKELALEAAREYVPFFKDLSEEDWKKRVAKMEERAKFATEIEYLKSEAAKLKEKNDDQPI